MNFTEIFNGMVGKDFITAFNDNFKTTDRALLSILATLLYKVKSTDIKEFKVIEGVVSYTLEEPPEDGEEDTREWHPVDITRWGNILGDLEEQTDLKNALDSKAAVETVDGLLTTLSTLRLEFNNLRDNYEDTEIIVSQNQQDVADLKQVDKTKVSSSNIKAIRVSDAEFQWSTDGITWMSIPITTSIAWGNLTGDIENQGDLMDLFDNINNTMSSLSDTVGTLNNAVAGALEEVDDLSDTVGALNTLVSDKDAEYTTKFNNIDSDISDLGAADTALDTKIDNHTANTENPHQVTKDQVGLGNVDNTADADKPLSTNQQTYIDNQVQQVVAQLNSFMRYNGLANRIFVGTASAYEQTNKDSLLAFVLRDDWQITINEELLFVYNAPKIVGDVTVRNVDQISSYYNKTYKSDNVVMGGHYGVFTNIPDGHYSIDYIKYRVIFNTYVNPTTGAAFELDSPAHTQVENPFGLGRMMLLDNRYLKIDEEITAYMEENNIDYIGMFTMWVPNILSEGDIVIESTDQEIVLEEMNYYFQDEPEVDGFRCAGFINSDRYGSMRSIPLDKQYTLSYSLPGDTDPRQVTFSLTESNTLLPLLLVDENLGNPPEIHVAEFKVVSSGGDTPLNPTPIPVNPEEPENEGQE